MSAVFQKWVRSCQQRHLAELDIGTQKLTGQVIKKILAYGAPMGAVLEHHPRLGRCMDRLQEMMTAAEAGGGVLAAGTTVIADTLNHSLGRFDRSWYAPPGGIWLTTSWPDVLLPEFSRLLPFAAGMACCKTVRSYQVDAQLKWVNDVLVKGRKIAGILCSTVERPQGDRYHLLGIGLNGNNQHFPQELQDTATSLVGEIGREIDQADCIGRLLAELHWAVGMLHYDEEVALHQLPPDEEKRSSLLLTAWRQLSDTVGRKVLYGFDVQKKPLYRAVVTDLDPGGGLIMELDDRSTLIEYSGEILYE